MFLQFQAGAKQIFLVRDHALALLCWKKAYSQGKIGHNATLVHIDAHTDFAFDPKHEKDSRNLLMMSDKDAEVFVHRLARDNSEFIVCAMLANLVGDGICIYARKGKDYGKFVKGTGITTDKLMVDDHRFFLCNTQNLAGLTLPGSFLADPLKHLDTYQLFHSAPSIILDIDLDFFTYLNEQVYVKNHGDIVQQLTSRAFQLLWEKASVVTIALEPGCCGGEDACLEILELLNTLVLKQPTLIPEAREYLTGTRLAPHALDGPTRGVF